MLFGHPLRVFIFPAIAWWTLACGAAPPGDGEGQPAAPDRVSSPVEALRGSTDAGSSEGYARADGPRTFVFPDDHGPHPDFRTEWWYWVGELRSTDGHRFGFQLTFFQQAMAPPDPAAPARPSAWASRHVMMAHFALADIDGGSFRSSERFSRTAAGLAGAWLDSEEESPRLRVWLEDWSVESAVATDEGPAERPREGSRDPIFPLRMRASGDDAELDLRLDLAKPPVLQGEGGWSRKGTSAGSASYYYSMPHLPAQGSLVLDDRSFEVEGRAWLDREWSTSQLEEDQAGWDWLALWLDDGREIMAYNLRLTHGEFSPTSHGALIATDGSHRHLDFDDYRLEPEGGWTSPRSGATYPAGWRLRIPEEGLDLRIEPLLADQELAVTFRYWEGAVGIRDTASAEVLGSGYLEMVGYGNEGEKR